MPKPCTVALLRPPETSYTSFFRQQALEQEGTADTQVYDPYIDDWCDMYRERITQVGEEVGVLTDVREHQLHEDVVLPHRKSRRDLVRDSDIITTIDPPQQLAAFVLGTVSQQPHMRSVFAYSTREGLEEAFETIGTAKVPVLITREVRVGLIILLQQEVSLRMIPKIFAFIYRREDQMHNALTQAFRYPNCSDVAGQWPVFTPETSSPHTGPA